MSKLNAVAAYRVASFLELVAIGAGIVAAGLWLWASLTPLPPFPEVRWDASPDAFKLAHKALVTGSKRNAWAAVATAFAVTCQAIAAVIYQVWSARP